MSRWRRLWNRVARRPCRCACAECEREAAAAVSALSADREVLDATGLWDCGD